VTDNGATQPDDVDVESEVNAGLNLSPRTEVATAKRRTKRRWGPILVLVLVIAAGGVVITQFLGKSLDYYCNVDEVGVKASCSGERSLRVQGTVEKGSLTKEDTQTKFVIAFNGKTMPVVYDGDPGGKFQECIPVVVRGRLSSGTFLGNEVEVKHSNEYAAKNKARLAAASSTACPKAG
jgi:cytochrome c-type biogenesis protein CcmE